MAKKIWIILLAIFLVAYALLSISNFQFEQSGFLMGVLAGATGIFAFLDR